MFLETFSRVRPPHGSKNPALLLITVCGFVINVCEVLIICGTYILNRPNNSFMPSNRREFLLTAGTVSSIAMAGCMGDDDGNGNGDPDGDTSSGNGDSVDWPPSQGILEWQHTEDTGGVADLVVRTMEGVVVDHYDGIDAWAVEARPQAQGIPAWNSLHDADPDGTQIIFGQPVSAFIQEVANPEADYNTRDFDPFCTVRTWTRDVALNPRTMPIEGHFEMTWDDIAEYAVEEGMTVPYANATQRLMVTLLQEWDPRLNEDNWQIVEVPGGGEARAAMERGELDCYVGIPFSAMSHLSDSYRTQVQLVPDTDEYADYWKNLKGFAENAEPEPAEATDEFLLEASEEFPQEEARKVSQASVGTYTMWTTPGVPSEIHDEHVAAFESAVEDDEFAEALHEAEAISEEEYTPIVGEANQTIIDDAAETILEDEVINEMVKELFS
ncbi:hypothetical protein OB919_11740 [Halobacteria archaeon AArc-curdl1]|uniref:Uncharacterized protein n=1 Tax=Natronosalvus hydrolyticus TaxID=2979988 RepID=A0AAP2Z980_9EURY|nr:hypothetical protein [Halobacteria archaeon AArc-curdl1]